jgi:hypothetical protein
MILTRGVSHCSLAIYIKKYLKAKEELWKFKYFTIVVTCSVVTYNVVRCTFIGNSTKQKDYIMHT